MQSNKVFTSGITRANKPPQNNLYDLIKVTPATPTIHIASRIKTLDNFEPKTGKEYVPKKRSRVSKVKTVREIRKLFEADTYPDLTKDLEYQQNLLLKKIRGGSSREENTKSLAKNILKSEKPISRSAWQMLMNINPDVNPHAIQYVLWNGRRIRINGSKGGKSKFICKFDLSKIRTQPKKKVLSNTFKKKGLLRNSLSVKFKPGPLCKKKSLDNSHQKYNVGATELVKLPKPGLNVRPVFGVTLDPTIEKFVQNLRDVNGTISETWAELSVCVLGTVKDSKIVQNMNQTGVTFELNYKFNQKRLLMRHDDKSSLDNENEGPGNSETDKRENTELFPEIKSMVAEMIDCVEIHLQQDSFCVDDEPRRQQIEESMNSSVLTKDKVKRRNTELNRLDVTVIRLPDDTENEAHQDCNKSYCSLGCVCASLNRAYHIKPHCGRIECMFECKCNFSKYKFTDSLEEGDSHLLPGLLKLDSELNSKLAKEEQKFHQTVVVTGEKSVLLKSERRNWKASKRYGEFYSNMCLKNDVKALQDLSIPCVKLDLENIEPWCMVHSLYKCFCKGKFTQDSESCNNTIIEETEKTVSPIDDDPSSDDSKNSNKYRIHTKKSNFDKYVRKIAISENSDVLEHDNTMDTDVYNTCARIKPYNGRKFTNTYYKNTNKKIFEMEENDDQLRKKMITIINKIDESSDSLPSTPNKDSSSDPLQEKQLLSHDINDYKYDDVPTTVESKQLNSEKITCEPLTMDIQDRSILQTSSNKTKLIAWLESSYKLHKQRLNQGLIKKTLEPPKHGKVALYPWDFILSRYKERKNLFLISKQKPFRIFMAVDSKNQFFENCINIDDIRFADLHKYPVTVKNLLTNATDLNDNFCILCGLSYCWELIGSVAKTKEKDDANAKFENVTDIKNCTQIDKDQSPPNPETTCRPQTLNQKKSIQVQEIQESKYMETDLDSSESSKWFVMTVENDFNEIQFYTRGFFVKYESIIKAINVARLSGKTVRLSSQKCTEQAVGPQFGIYAIPNANEYCVFVGPYDKDESLGIETVKSISDIRKYKKTRGVWITTKKMDNSKVIDNPLSFMPPTDLHPSKIVSLESTMSPKLNESNCDVQSERPTQAMTAEKEQMKRKLPVPAKLTKPIKILKAGGFYHLTPQKLQNLQTHSIPSNRPGTSKMFSSASGVTELKSILKLPLPKLHHYNVASSNSPLQNKPVAEIAPQMKPIQDEVSESGTAQTNTKKVERSMFVLKPEEINKRLFEKGTVSVTSTVTNNEDLDVSENSDIDEDIEKFLATSVVCSPPTADVLEISDEEDDGHPTVEDVWIECENYDYLGWLRGRRNADNQLSFEFPGFKFTEFYNEMEAFTKINQVLSRKVCIPKNMTLEWRVVSSADELKAKRKLEQGDLRPHLVLTKRGIRNKQDLMIVDKISDLEEQEKNVEAETDELMKKFEPIRSLRHCMSEVSRIERQRIAENLQTILVNNTEEEKK